MYDNYNPQHEMNNSTNNSPINIPPKRFVSSHIKLGIILLVFGIIITSIMSFIYYNNLQNQKYLRTTKAIISDMITYEEYDYEDNSTTVHTDVYVDYEIDGVEYDNIRLSYYYISMDIGDEIEITYDIRSPETPLTSPTITHTIFIIFIGVGIILIILGIAQFIKAHKIKQRNSLQ